MMMDEQSIQKSRRRRRSGFDLFEEPEPEIAIGTESEQRPSIQKRTRRQWEVLDKREQEARIEKEKDESWTEIVTRVFGVVASTLGIPTLFPLLKIFCRSKVSSKSRYIGIKIVQQIAILMRSEVLPHLNSLLEIIEKGLKDENHEVKIVTALSVSALAEVVAPYGIESFHSVLKLLWQGICSDYWNENVLAPFFKAVGFIIPLMSAKSANYNTKELMNRLIRCFKTSDEETKKTVLIVVKQCVSTQGVEAYYISNTIVPYFFPCFWPRKTVADNIIYDKQLVDTTLEIAKRIGAIDTIWRIVEGLKDESEPHRRMTMETIGKIFNNWGEFYIVEDLECLLFSGMINAFKYQTSEISDDIKVMLTGFAAVVNASTFKTRSLPRIRAMIRSRATFESRTFRQQALDLESMINIATERCKEEGHVTQRITDEWILRFDKPNKVWEVQRC